MLNVEKDRWHSLECLELGSVLYESKDGQTRIVLDAKAEGASIRQVMSHTGWSYRRVREAGDEVVVKSKK